MRRWSTVVATLVLLAGCATRPGRSAPAPFAGPPALPATFGMADQSTPPLPARGPIGRGTLLYRSPQNPFAPVLLLENGRQFRLPATPTGEGRQGSLFASLSPDGRWLGHRVAAYSGDTRYVLQELTGARVITADGIPVLWSTNSQYVVMSADERQTGRLTLVEPTNDVRTSIGARSRDGLGLTGVLPDGQLLFTSMPSRLLRLRTDRADTTVVADTIVVFAAGPEDECWCPQLGVHVSPDGRTVSVQLAYENGLIPGTGEKSRPMPNAVVIAVIDRVSGTVVHRIKPAAAGPADSWWLLSDTGSGLLLMRAGADGTALVLLDPATGSQHLATELPDRVSVIVPGQIDRPSDG